MLGTHTSFGKEGQKMKEKKISNPLGADSLSMLFDNGNYAELGAHIKRNAGSDENEGVVCGYGPVDGRLVFAFAQDSARLNGAFDSRSAKKIGNLYELALKSGAPVVGIFGCGGSVVTEGASLLSGIGKLYSCISLASGEIPQIALVSGSCTGSIAVAASMFDFTVSVKGSELAYGAKFVTEADTSLAAYNGALALEAENEADAFAKTRQLVSVLPDSAECGPAFSDETDMDRATGIADASDAKALIAALSDNGSFTELYEKLGGGITVGFAPVAGRYAGIVAAYGEISAEGASKAASFVGFCSSFSLPIITLINSEGFEVSENAEKQGIGRAIADLAGAYRMSSGTKISAVVGSAIGSVLPVFGTREGAADVSFALDSAVIAPMSPAKAVAFLMNDKITAEKSREELEAEWAANEASAEKAASDGDIDFIVTLDELRPRLCSALMMLERE